MMHVKVTGVNKGDAAIKKGDVEFLFQGDEGWTGAALALAGEAAPGELATFEGDLGVPAAPGRYTISFRPVHAGVAIGSPLAADVDVGCDDGIVWSISEDCYGGLELDASNIWCACGYNFNVRPCSFTNYWGGLNTDSCNTPSQTIDVVCEY